MAEPTLKDVLEVLTAFQRETRDGLASLERKLETTRAELAAHRAETAAGFASLDKELSLHAKVHAELEKDVEASKRRPARTAARPGRR